MSEHEPVPEPPTSGEGYLDDKHRDELIAYNEKEIREGYDRFAAEAERHAAIGNPDGLDPAPDNMFTDSANASKRILQSGEMEQKIARGAKETGRAFDEVKLLVDQVREEANMGERADLPEEAQAREKMESHLKTSLKKIGATGDEPFVGFGAGRKLANDWEFRSANGQAFQASAGKMSGEQYRALRERQHADWQALDTKHRADEAADYEASVKANRDAALDKLDKAA